MTILSFITYFLAVLTFFISIIIVMENRNPSRTMAWLLVLILLPVVGVFLYLYIGQNHRKKKTFIKKRKHDYEVLRQLLKEQASFSKNSYIFKETFKDLRGRLVPLLMNNTQSPITVNNQSQILKNGDNTYSQILTAIKEAKDHIHMEYFIIKESEIGFKIQQALIERAKAGVKVRLIYDAVGCWKASKKFFLAMQDAGVELYPFLPVTIPLFGSRLNYRNHRKILVIDGIIGFLGGINIGDEYLGKNPRLGYWRDTHLKIKGEALYVLQSIFLMDWHFVSGEELDGRRYFPKQGHCGEQMIQIAASGPDSYWESIHQAYFTAINSATDRVYFVTPYLIPDEGILMALKTAALSGVDVRIILPGRYDHKTVFWASRSHFMELLEAGVKIYEYQKGFIHSKIVIADNNFASIGTANMDIRSFQLNFEVNAFIYDTSFNKEMYEDFLQDLKDCKEILLVEHKKRGISYRVKESIARLFSPIL